MNRQKSIEKTVIGLIGAFLFCYYVMLFDFHNLLTVLIGGCICLLLWFRHQKIEVVIGTVLLAVTVLSYYIIRYGFKSALVMGLPYVGIVMGLLGICLSCEAKRRSDSEKLLYGILFILILGFSIHGFLNSYMFFAGFCSKNKRNWYDFWLQVILPATEQVVYFLPVLAAMLPALMYFKNRKLVNLFFLFASVYFLWFSWISNSRMPIFILPMLMAAQIGLYMILERKHVGAYYQKNKTKLCVMALVILLGLAAFIIIDNPVMLAIQEKMGRDGGLFGSVRFVAQRKALQQLFLYPMGGSQMDFGRIAYAHNTWLDMANRAGLIPFFAFTLYTGYSIYELIRWLAKKEIPMERKLIMAGMYGVFFLYYSAERGIEGSIHFMTPWFFINGMIHGELLTMNNRKSVG